MNDKQHYFPSSNSFYLFFSASKFHKTQNLFFVVLFKFAPDEKLYLEDDEIDLTI